MAAFSIHQLASGASIELAQFAARVSGAVGEVVLFLWTVLALAFTLLVMAGFVLPSV